MANDDLRCARCGIAFEKSCRVACISGKIMGDECTDCYYWCAGCGVYTLRMYRDVFAGPETTRDCGPISKEEGDRRLGMIRACTEPHNERCRCAAHRAYFGGWLD